MAGTSMAVSLLFIVLNLNLQQVNAILTEVVNTTKGPIQGRILETVLEHTQYLAFQGIPYAKPPIGALRFKPPVEIEPWTEVKKTIEDNSVCIQFDSKRKITTGSEDCLYLSVFVPVLKNQSNLNVLVHFPGGGYHRGSGNKISSGPDFLIETGIVIVNCNYRLGALGFASLGIPEVSGNAGLKDQNLVLRWVKDNIRNFGGSPDKVTIYGASAGASSVDFHMLSDLSRGLYQKSISSSGSPYNIWAFKKMEDAKYIAFKLGKLLNNGNGVQNSTELLRVLKMASAEDIVLKTQKLNVPLLPFTPVLESADPKTSDVKFLTTCYHKKYSQGNYSKVPYMMGFSNDEYIFFAKYLDNWIKKEKMMLARIVDAIASMPLLSSFKGYFENAANAIVDLSIYFLQEIVKIETDITFKKGIDLKQQKMTESSNTPIYYYVYNYNAKNYSLHYAKKNITEIDGVSHVDEVPLLFYDSTMNIPINPNPEYDRIRKQMVTIWTNFIKFGNPTPAGEKDEVLKITWPISGKTGKHLVIGKQLIVKNERPTDFKIAFDEVIGRAVASIQSDCIKSTIIPSAILNSPLSPLWLLKLK